jgi:BMFP domain-containing protein YqiC
MHAIGSFSASARFYPTGCSETAHRKRAPEICSTTLVRTKDLPRWTCGEALGYPVCMLDKLPIDELSRRLADALPAGVSQVTQDIEKTFHGILQSTFTKMNLVSREEFEVQRAVLARTRTKLEQLEIQVAELEKRLQQP